RLRGMLRGVRLGPGCRVRDVSPDRGVQRIDEKLAADDEHRNDGEEDPVEEQLASLARPVAVPDDGAALVVAHRVDVRLLMARKALLDRLALDDRVRPERRRGRPELPVAMLVVFTPRGPRAGFRSLVGCLRPRCGGTRLLPG